MTNEHIARSLLAHARSMPRETNLYRQRAYRQAALLLQGLDEPVESILGQRGRCGLAAIRGIGEHLAVTIETLVRTGRVISRSEPPALALA